MSLPFLSLLSCYTTGSVIGPKLFLLYINDLPEHIKSNVSLFDDDTFIYRILANHEDYVAFQNDILSIENWLAKWLMPLNIAKTQLICFGKANKTNPSFHYSLGGSIIQEVKSVKYLGVTISNNMLFTEHIIGKTKKAMQIIGLLKRALWNAPQKAKLIAYKSLCRPILEYAAVVWDPDSKQQAHKLEMVQNRA